MIRIRRRRCSREDDEQYVSEKGGEPELPPVRVFPPPDQMTLTDALEQQFYQLLRQEVLTERLNNYWRRMSQRESDAGGPNHQEYARNSDAAAAALQEARDAARQAGTALSDHRQEEQRRRENATAIRNLQMLAAQEVRDEISIARNNQINRELAIEEAAFVERARVRAAEITASTAATNERIRAAAAAIVGQQNDNPVIRAVEEIGRVVADTAIDASAAPLEIARSLRRLVSMLTPLLESAARLAPVMQLLQTALPALTSMSQAAGLASMPSVAPRTPQWPANRTPAPAVQLPTDERFAPPTWTTPQPQEAE